VWFLLGAINMAQRQWYEHVDKLIERLGPVSLTEEQVHLLVLAFSTQAYGKPFVPDVMANYKTKAAFQEKLAEQCRTQRKFAAQICAAVHAVLVS